MISIDGKLLLIMVRDWLLCMREGLGWFERLMWTKYHDCSQINFQTSLKTVQFFQIQTKVFQLKIINKTMKDQFSSTYDDPIVANQRLKNKLDFLERQSIKRQNYLKDLQRNFKLAKSTINSLTQKSPVKDEIITQLQQQNTALTDKLKEEYNGICRLNALYLMECQLRIEETKSFNQRIKDFEENMAELRRYLHDKEESFSFVAEKLKRFEELLPNQQLTMYQKLVNYSAILKEEIRWKDVFGQIIEDRDVWKKQAEEAKDKCAKLEILVQGMRLEPDFQKFELYISNMDPEQVSRTYAAIVMNTNLPSHSRGKQIQKPNSNQSTNVTYAETSKQFLQPNMELIRLMKKEKLSNKILQVALSEALDKNMELIEYNQRLIEANEYLRKEVDVMIADMVVMCHALKRYEQNYRTKIQIMSYKWAKCDLDMPSYREIIDKYKNNSLEEANEIVFTKMRNDVAELTEYIALCNIQKTNNIQSYESPCKPYEDSKNFELSMNDKELSINQI